MSKKPDKNKVDVDKMEEVRASQRGVSINQDDDIKNTDTIIIVFRDGRVGIASLLMELEMEGYVCEAFAFIKNSNVNQELDTLLYSEKGFSTSFPSFFKNVTIFKSSILAVHVVEDVNSSKIEILECGGNPNFNDVGSVKDFYSLFLSKDELNQRFIQFEG